MSTNLTGTFRATGQIASDAGNLAGALGGLLGRPLGRERPEPAGKELDQRADIRGNVTVTSRPSLLPGWRMEPSSRAGRDRRCVPDHPRRQVNVSNEVKPLLDRTVNEQIAALQARVRDDPFLEVAARREWTKMCRSIALGAAAPGMPNLWLEMRPTRAFAAQPRIERIRRHAYHRRAGRDPHRADETKPECPFPAQLELVPQIEQGRVNIAVPIDVPFTEVNRLLEAQLKGKTFPEDKSGAFTATVGASILRHPATGC